MKSFRICMQNIRKWNSNPRILMAFMLALLFSYTYTKGMSVACDYLGENMSPWLYPFMFTYRYMKITLMFPLVFIFCDAPFIDDNQPYVILRVKRITWSIGQIMYIFVTSFIYMLSLIATSIIVNIGRITPMMSWGRVIGLCGTTNILQAAGVNYSTIHINGTIVKYYTPFQAMFFSCLLTWLSFVIIGLIIFSLNTLTNTKYAGTAAAAALILFTSVVDGKARLTWYSPISWNSLNNIDIGHTTLYPTIEFILTMYLAMIVVLVVMSILGGKRQCIERG